MASQPSHQDKLTKLADKLNKNYYPLTQLLCNNAKVQAQWLYDNNAEAIVYLDLCNALSDRVTGHLAMSRAAIAGLKDSEPSIVICNGATLLQSREAICQVLSTVKDVAAQNKIAEWTEMQENLRMKLTVLNNLLLELFRIEDADLIPLLEKNLSMN